MQLALVELAGLDAEAPVTTYTFHPTAPLALEEGGAT
jgi:hypothetical protein